MRSTPSLTEVTNSQIPPPHQVIDKVTDKGNFQGKLYSPIPDHIADRMYGKSWNERCPVPMKDLVYVTVTHWDFNGQICTGELVFHKNLADEIIQIFLELFEDCFQINKMVLIDDYDADDLRSCADNNSSAFGSRDVTGKPGVFSKHSYGGAIDLNPVQNPYIKGDVVLPEAGRMYIDRTQDAPGLIKKGGPCYKPFIKRGYVWGGEAVDYLKDYQQFHKVPEDFIESENEGSEGTF